MNDRKPAMAGDLRAKPVLNLDIASQFGRFLIIPLRG